jgi:hypothetical protein
MRAFLSRSLVRHWLKPALLLAHNAEVEGSSAFRGIRKINRLWRYCRSDRRGTRGIVRAQLLSARQ